MTELASTERSLSEGATDPSVDATVRHAIDGTLTQIQASLDKEGASVDLEVDSDARQLVVTMVRHRIVCEGCLLPADLVKTMLTKALKQDPASKSLKFTVETRNWLIEPN